MAWHGHRTRSVVGAVGLLVGVGLLSVGPVAGLADPVPIAHWAMDEGSGSTAADSGANGADLAISGASWVADGHSGSALHVDGIDDTLTAPAGAMHTTEVTVALWIRADPAKPPANGSPIIEFGSRAGCGQATWGLYAFNGSFTFRWLDEAGTWLEAGGYEIEGHELWDGEWHHIAATTSTASYAYLLMSLDGYSTSFTVASPAFDHTGLAGDILRIGRPANGCVAPDPFVGEVDDLRLYDEQLTLDQIGALLPPIGTTTTVIGPTTGTPATANCYGATVTPAPNGGEIFLVVAKAGGTTARYPMNLMVPGVTTMESCPTLHPGSYTIHTEFTGRRPWLPSTSMPVTLTIAKLPATGLVGGRTQQLSSQTTWVEGYVDGNGDIPTGSIVFFEIVNGQRAARGSAQLAFTGTNTRSGASLALPPRASGTYTFEIDYAGDQDHLPTTASGTIVVHQDVVPGTVTINGGAPTTSSPIVTLSAPAQAAIGTVVSNSGTLYRTYYPYQSSVPGWSLIDPAAGGAGGEGLKTVYVRWYNVFNEDTEDATASIYYDTSAPSGTVSVAGGASATKSASVTLSLPAKDTGSYVTAAQISNDGTKWKTVAYQPTVAWNLADSQFGGTTTNGTKTVRVRYQDLAGRWSAAASDAILLDTTAPTAIGPTWRLGASGTALASGAVPVRVAWTGSDAQSGIAHYALSVATDGGPFVGIAGSIAGTAIDRNLAPGHTYRFAIRPYDKAGNAGALYTGSTFRLSAIQQTSTAVRYSGTWATSTTTTWWGGTARSSSSAGATARITVTGRSFAWIALKAPNRGKASIYVNGIKVATIDLAASTMLKQRLVWSTTWASSATRTVMIRVAGTAGRPRVDVDGFVVGR